jgi:hypothetical protein
MSSPTLDPAPTLRKHLDAYATVSDAHRTTHKELKEYAATVEQMRTLLASVQALPDAYGDRLMGEAETQRLRQEQDAMMRTLRATRRALGLGKEGREVTATPAKTRAVNGVSTSEATRASDESEAEEEGESEAEAEGSEAEAEGSEAEAEGSETEEEESETEEEESESVGSEDDGEATSESLRDTEEDGNTNDDSRTSSASSEAVDDGHKDSEDPSSSEDASAATSSQDDASASVSASAAPLSTSAATAAAPAPTPKPKTAAASRRSKLAPPRKVASTPAATPTPAPAAEDVRILPLPTAHHRAQDARLKRLKMLQARTGRPVFVSDRAEGAGGRRRRRREVRRGWRGEGRV